MSDASSLEALVLKLFAETRDHKLSATSLRDKLASAAKKSSDQSFDLDKVDEAIAALIDAGKLAVTGGGKNGQHPRPKGSYRLTGAGKDHVKPQKPDVSDELSRNQEAYILFQFLRTKDGGLVLSRGELTGKLKTRAAKEKFELEPTDNKATIDYHLHELVRNGNLAEKRQGVSTIYTMTDEGLKTLGTGQQYDDPEVNFTLNGPALNKLLGAARQSTGSKHPHSTHQTEAPSAPVHHAASKSAEVEPKQIHDFIAHLRADKYAGYDRVPIHEVRALVRQHHGDHAASHPLFDRLLKTMASEGDLKIQAIADSRDTPQQHLDDAIPGMNEILFFINTK